MWSRIDDWCTCEMTKTMNGRYPSFTERQTCISPGKFSTGYYSPSARCHTRVESNIRSWAQQRPSKSSEVCRCLRRVEACLALSGFKYYPDKAGHGWLDPPGTGQDHPMSFANNPIAVPILSAIAIKGCLAFSLSYQNPSLGMIRWHGFIIRHC